MQWECRELVVESKKKKGFEIVSPGVGASEMSWTGNVRYEGVSGIKGLFEVHEHMPFSRRAQRKQKVGSIQSWILPARYK